MGDAVSGKSYAQLLKVIQDLIAEGTKISDASAGTPSAQIHRWVSKAEYCLSLLEEQNTNGSFGVSTHSAELRVQGE